MTNYRKYGELHGTAMHYDASKPDADAFLAHMESRLDESGLEEYLDGYMESCEGQKRREYRCMRGLAKEGSDA